MLLSFDEEKIMSRSTHVIRILLLMMTTIPTTTSTTSSFIGPPTTSTTRTTTTTTTRRIITTTPLGCDTFVAFPPCTAILGQVIFGKNSDRPKGEGQSIHRYPAKDYIKSTNNEDELLLLACTYISIPQVPHTHAVLLSQIDWMWGVEHGVNEHGVAIGNEAVWTKVKDDEDMSVKRLLGMDLVRLGLERGGTAQEALEVITTLLQVHGQGGPCSEDGDPTFCYHNSFLIADSREAWVLETAGRHWVAQRCTKGGRNISNALTIRTDYDLSSNGLEEYAQQKKLWNPTTTTNTKLDWAKCFGEEGTIEECESKFSRHGCGRALLEKHSTTSSSGTLTVQGMMEILRNHGSGICMHGGFETTASMVCELQARRHWMMDTPHPCQNEYQEQSVILLEKG